MAFYGFVHEIVGAIHEMGHFYGFVCLIMLEGCVGLGGCGSDRLGVGSFCGVGWSFCVTVRVVKKR